MEYKRLTKTSEITDSPTLIALCESCGEDGCDDNCAEYQTNNCAGCPVQEAFERLSAYEDTEHSPDDLQMMIRAYQEFANAKEENRLVELPIPIGGEYYRIWDNKAISGPLPVYNWNALMIAERYLKSDFPTREAAEIALKAFGGDTQ
jgi:hypothetical protein